MSHIWVSHGTQIIKSCQTYEWVMSHILCLTCLVFGACPHDCILPHCNKLQHTATHIMRLACLVFGACPHDCSDAVDSHIWTSHAWQHTATHCNILQHIVTYCVDMAGLVFGACPHHRGWFTHDCILQHAATRCNTLQHTASRCITLQHTAAHCNTHNRGWFTHLNESCRICEWVLAHIGRSHGTHNNESWHT